MTLLSYLRSVASRFFRRAELEDDLQSELQSHIEFRTDALCRLGLSRAEAERRARLEFGSYERAREECRDAFAGRFLDVLFQDLRFSVRMLLKSRGFTVVVLLTIALSVGGTAAIFSVVDATLLRPLPYPHAEELVSLQADFPGIGAQDVGMSQPEWLDFQHSGIFEFVSPTWFDENNLTGSSEPQRVRLTIVAPNYFALLGAKPHLGRIFDPQNYTPGFTGEVVISDSLWKRAFGADPHILEKSVRMDTDVYRIIGVMPAGFDAPGRTAEERNVEIWAATSFFGPPMRDEPARNARNLPTAIARLKPGLSLTAAQSRLDALVASLQKQDPADYPPVAGWKVRILPLQDRLVGNVRQPLVLLLCAVAVVLLIACVNVANLMLARASTRQREMAIRQALGAGRKRLAVQLLTESLLLALCGGAIGLTLLFAAKDALLRFVPETLPRLNEVTINCQVLFFAIAAALCSGLAFGVGPALQTERLDLSNALNQEGRGASSSRERAHTRRLLVVSEFALSVVLMIAAGLLLHSFWDLLNVRLGFNPQSIMTVRTRMPYPNDVSVDKYATAAQEAPFLRELVRRCKLLPAVDDVAIGDPASIPLDQDQRQLNALEGQFFFEVEGKQARPDAPPVAEYSRVTPDYFHLLGIQLQRGRFFNHFDTDATDAVAIVNQSFAQTYWPGEDAIGKRLKEKRANSRWLTVIGVVPNARTQSLAQIDTPQVYVDIYQSHAKHLAILLRGRLNPALIPDQVRQQVQAIDPTLPVFGARTLNQTVSESLAQRRFSLQIVTLFALSALLLAALGIYGVISYIVSERTQEIGIRLALGAQRHNILQIILSQGLKLALVGAAIGLACAVVVSHLMATLLYGVTPTDPLTFATVVALFLGVALAACYLPARRATKLDPVVALRSG